MHIRPMKQELYVFGDSVDKLNVLVFAFKMDSPASMVQWLIIDL